MVVKTKCFGEIDITEEKIISFEKGLFGFEEYKDYTILYDTEKEGKVRISWLQSIEEPALAFPMLNPLLVDTDYKPSVANDSLAFVEPLTEENIAMFLIITVPGDIKKMTANLKAPIIINSETRKAVQAIADNAEYMVKKEIYHLLAARGEQAC